jgi:hypothetical protein
MSLNHIEKWEVGFENMELAVVCFIVPRIFMERLGKNLSGQLNVYL